MDDIINIKVTETGLEEVALTIIEEYERNITTGAKVNASLGLVLQNRETGELRYFHFSLNNLALVERPVMIGSTALFTDFAKSIVRQDLAERLRQKRPNSKWIVHKLTNITFYFYKIDNSARIGAPVTVPRYIKNSRSILSLTASNRTG